MSTPAATFSSNMTKWAEYELTPWSRLKHTVVQSNLRRHLAQAPLKILDAGGGNGLDSLPLAAKGHGVTIVDYSAEMLADARRKAADVNAQEHVATQLGDVLTLPQLCPAPSFDVVLCHNVLQYVDDVPALLAALAGVLKPGGWLSLIGVNRYALPYRAAFSRGDLVDAYAQLDQRSEVSSLFGATMTEYTAEEIVALLPDAGCELVQHYGVRCLCDYWGTNELKSDPVVFAALEKLELALTDRYPYKLLARYFQIVAYKH
jgi:S-adenosylmethionine-dependent methyltransferase